MALQRSAMETFMRSPVMSKMLADHLYEGGKPLEVVPNSGVETFRRVCSLWRYEAQKRLELHANSLVELDPEKFDDEVYKKKQLQAFINRLRNAKDHPLHLVLRLDYGHLQGHVKKHLAQHAINIRRVARSFIGQCKILEFEGSSSILAPIIPQITSGATKLETLRINLSSQPLPTGINRKALPLDLSKCTKLRKIQIASEEKKDCIYITAFPGASLEIVELRNTYIPHGIVLDGEPSRNVHTLTMSTVMDTRSLRVLDSMFPVLESLTLHSVQVLPGNRTEYLFTEPINLLHLKKLDLCHANAAIVPYLQCPELSSFVVNAYDHQLRSMIGPFLGRVSSHLTSLHMNITRSADSNENLDELIIETIRLLIHLTNFELIGDVTDAFLRRLTPQHCVPNAFTATHEDCLRFRINGVTTWVKKKYLNKRKFLFYNETPSFFEKVICPQLKNITFTNRSGFTWETVNDLRRSRLCNMKEVTRLLDVQGGSILSEPKVANTSVRSFAFAWQGLKQAIKPIISTYPDLGRIF